MRFISFVAAGRTGTAIRLGSEIRGLTASDVDFPGTLDALLAGGAEAMQSAHDVLAKAKPIDPTAIEYRPPLHRPGKILCIGLNYREHSAESGHAQPTYPAIFARFPSSLIGHEQPLVRPLASNTLDFEGELAVIVGGRGRRIPLADALNYVAGYSVFNDGSIREFQHKTGQWTVGKNFDGTGAFGPEFITANELPPGADGLKIETRLNGATVQSANTREMVFNVASLIAILSEAITLEPGDVIVSGTPSGVGHARTPKLYMKNGDVSEVEIEGVGRLRNVVADERNEAVFAA